EESCCPEDCRLEIRLVVRPSAEELLKLVEELVAEYNPAYIRIVVRVCVATGLEQDADRLGQSDVIVESLNKLADQFRFSDDFARARVVHDPPVDGGDGRECRNVIGLRAIGGRDVWQWRQV